MIIITKKEIGFDEFRFLALAINQNLPVSPLTQSYRNILVENGKAVATDGHRLHIIKELTNPLHDGQYRVIKVTKIKVELEPVTSPADYPDYNRIIPHAPELINFRTSNIHHKYAQIIRHMSEGTLMFDLFRDAVESQDFTQFAAKNHHSPVILDGENCFALIMPMRG